jgi:hypothetical protein
MKRLSYFLVIASLLCCAIYAQSPGVEVTIPHGTCVTMDVVEVEASGSTRIYPHWTRTKLVIEKANGVSEQFRVTVATTTVDTDLPLRDSFTASVKGSCYFSIQPATDTAKFVVNQYQD